ncbi:MAG: Flp pilus assembly complex ATPase component TadA, partial [Clostridia bacterium]|nr:Flp pilus assembly complex ATPase component TadA [Clostridia bacterium]
MTKYTVESINSSARHDPDGFVRQSTKNYLNAVEKAAKSVLENKKKIVMLAGPSSSGKTTTAGILSGFIEKNGKEAKIISLDDFYLASLDLYPLNSDGSYNFESIHSLDLPLIN